MTPLGRYAALLRSLPDKPVLHPTQPVLVPLSEHIGAPAGLSVNAVTLVEWGVKAGKISASIQWKLRETFTAWEKDKPTRTQVATFMDWLDGNLK